MSFNEIAIKVKDLAKRYEIYERPGDRLKQFILPRLQSSSGLKTKNFFREFWALRDISFQVKRGETVGIIGRNGSGKSTLLQIICGTLRPTSGLVQTNGRIAALLELGSGFNPEFTGRENVYLNASVLGLTKKETDERLLDILSFADIGDFIDQPIKTYSSGMMVRLAFAVIAHVNADVLIVDEALAVGDAFFTQKCMRFIRAFKERGTLFLVSHDMGAILNLCDSAIWLDSGTIRKLGDAKSVTEEYIQFSLQDQYGGEVNLESVTGSSDSDIYETHSEKNDIKVLEEVGAENSLVVLNNLERANGWRTGLGQILSVDLRSSGGQNKKVFEGGEKVSLSIRAISFKDMDSPIIGFLVRDRLGQDLFGENTLPFTDRHTLKVKKDSIIEAEFEFYLPMLPNGEFIVMTSFAEGSLEDNIQHHWLHDALVINVASKKVRWGLVGIPFQKIMLKESE